MCQSTWRSIRNKCLTKVRSAWLVRKMFIIFRKGYNDLIPSVYVGKHEIHKYIQYEVSMIIYVGRTANQRKVPKWLQFQNCKSESLTSWYTNTSGVCTMCTKYEVSTSYSVAKRAASDEDDDARHMMHKVWLQKALWLNQVSQKNLNVTRKQCIVCAQVSKWS